MKNLHTDCDLRWVKQNGFNFTRMTIAVGQSKTSKAPGILEVYVNNVVYLLSFKKSKGKSEKKSQTL